jgi:hypothetical protein
MLAITLKDDLQANYISGYEIMAAVTYHGFWILWLAHWFTSFDEGSFVNAPDSQHSYLNLYATLIRIVTGVGLAEKGRMIRRMLGIGLIGLSLPSLILIIARQI